jgi:hypothetical protein
MIETTGVATTRGRQFDNTGDRIVAHTGHEGDWSTTTRSTYSFDCQ